MSLMKGVVPLLVLVALPVMAQSGAQAVPQPEDVINADRPGIADGSTTVGHAVFQVEVGAERDDNAHVHTLVTPLLLRYGLTKDFELRMETSGYGRVIGFGEDGFNPLSAGFKWHFVDEDTKTRRPSLGIIARIFPKSGSGAFRSDSTTGDLRLAADMTLNDKWSLNPNIGAAFGGGTTTALAALTLQYNVTEKANVFVDGGYANSALLVDIGGAWILGHDTQLDASVGWRAHGLNAPNVFIGAGISRRF